MTSIRPSPHFTQSDYFSLAAPVAYRPLLHTEASFHAFPRERHEEKLWHAKEVLASSRSLRSCHSACLSIPVALALSWPRTTATSITTSGAVEENEVDEDICQVNDLIWMRLWARILGL